MTIALRARLRATAALLAVLGLGACGEPPDDSPQRQTRERLEGTWLREYQENGVDVRRVLVLRPDGAFHESSVARGPSQVVAQDDHEGEWLFDGTNLKRRYTLMNGKQPSRLRMPFVTFELRFESPNEFVGIDHVHRRELVYRRVGEDTKP